MESPTTHGEPYTYARLHISTNSHPETPIRKLLASLDAKPLQGEYKDGTHYFAHVIDYRIDDECKRVHVIFGPLWRAQSNDGPLKWHLTGWQASRWETTFEECERLGSAHRSRARFKIPGGLLLILSRSTHDKKIITALTCPD